MAHILRYFYFAPHHVFGLPGGFASLTPLPFVPVFPFPPNGDEAGLFRLIRAAFSQRRKTAANAVANGLGISKAKVNAALQAAGLDIRLRPEQLTLEDYCALQAALAAAE